MDVLGFIESVWPILATGLGVSAISQKIKKWFDVQSPAVKMLIAALISGASVGLQAFISSQHENVGEVGEKASAVFLAANLAYFTPGIGVKAMSGIFQDAKVKREEYRIAQSDPNHPDYVAPIDNVEVEQIPNN